MKLSRIAMWSGPRNISTAMMRSWENRNDSQVIDEPLYGPYLHKTKKKHPVYSEIIADQGTNEQLIIDNLTHGELAENKTIYYQKHMCHHILQDMDITWVKYLKNAFLIRNPKYVLASYLKKHKHPTALDLGYPQQLKIFNFIKDNCAYTPIIMESKDILQNPDKMIPLLCKKLSVEFDINMLSWPKGYRDSDGIWATQWYNRVIESTGFSNYSKKNISLNSSQQAIVDECMPYYLELQKHKISV